MCRMSWNLGASTSWNLQGLPRPVVGLLYLYLICICMCVCVCVKCIVYVHVVGQGNSGLEHSQAQEEPALHINCNRRLYVRMCYVSLQADLLWSVIHCCSVFASNITIFLTEALSAYVMYGLKRITQRGLRKSSFSRSGLIWQRKG